METRVGQQLGNYRLVHLLGRGSFADVYLGEHLYLKTEAAVKVLSSRLAEGDVEEFLNEAQTIVRLVHPHIIRIFDYDIEAGTPFLVMDYAPNGTLRQRHQRAIPVPLPTIVHYTRQLAEALQYAHDRRLIHRDVKPENMLLGRRNDVLLSDFGIVQIVQSTHLETTQPIAGTVAYMSPEQLQGKARFASDQYALGIVVYEWLTGNLPFKGSFTEMAGQHIFAPPPPLHEKNLAISPAVEEVVMTALAKDPGQRFTSIQAFATALEQASRPWQPRPLISPQENPILASPMVQLSQWTGNQVPGDFSVPPRDNTSLDGKVQWAHSSPTNQSMSLQLASTPVIPNKLEPGNQGRTISRRAVIAGLVTAGLAVIGGSIWWRALASPSPYIYRGHSQRVTAVTWSPDSQRIASGSVDKTVQVWDAADGAHVFTYSGHSSYVNAAAWSPGGKRIASAGGTPEKTVQVWDAADGAHVFTYSGHSAEVYVLAWSPDGKRIASGSVDKTVQVWDAITAGTVFAYQGHRNVILAVTWSPDGTRIASGSVDKTVQIWDPADGSLVFTYRGHPTSVHTVAWSTDGKYIASASDDTVQIWDPADGSLVFTYRGHSDLVYVVAWSPDGRRIASGSYDHTVQVWDATNGGNVYTYHGHSDWVRALAWSPDGKHIASAGFDKTVQVWVAG